MVLKDVITKPSMTAESIIPGAITAFGVALVRTAAGVAKPALSDATGVVPIIGFSVQPANNVVLDEDAFYQATNDAGVPDPMRMVTEGEANLLVVTSANTSILQGDYLEVADLADHGQYLGLLEESGAGGNVGETRIINAVAKALEDKTMTNASYKQPSVNVVVGDKTATLTSGDLTLLDLSEGDYILLEDLDGSAQINRVKSKTAAVITLQLAATVALTANTDYIRKCFQVRCKILN